jgi:ABC-type proline/glycine betaine transport system ATPase subunit
LVARALLLEVKLLVADEIISMLDASTRVDVLNLLVSLKKRGLAVLFITHDLSLGNYISDRTIILRQGAVMEMGVTDKVFGNPQHSYTRSLLTAVPQLHRKWQQVESDLLPESAHPNGSDGGPEAAGTDPAGADPDGTGSRRYSKSPLHPARKSSVLPEGPGPRPSLMDIENAPWQRRGARAAKLDERVPDEAPPELVEIEKGHFVAVEG